MPKIYRCDAKYVSFENHNISCHDLSLLVSSAETICFHNVTFKDKNDSNVAVEKIVEIAVNAKRIKIWSATNRLNITSETMNDLLKITHFSKLNEFNMYGIPEEFDLGTFYDYMKKNQTTKLWLRFDNSISEACKNRLKEINDEILSAETFDYKPPRILFSGLDREKYYKLQQIFFSF